MECKDRIIKVRLSEQMMHDLSVCSKRRHISKGEYIRRMLENCYERRPGFHTYPILYKKYAYAVLTEVLNIRVSSDMEERIMELEDYYSTSRGMLIRKLITCYMS